MHQSNTSIHDMVLCARPGHSISKGTFIDECFNREWKHIKVAQDKATHYQS
jgi:hypothetical protein